MYVLFDKEHKFIGYGENFPDSPNLNIFMRKIPNDKINLMKWKWSGDMLNGAMVEITEENKLDNS
jgi:hypothetical protein